MQKYCLFVCCFISWLFCCWFVLFFSPFFHFFSTTIECHGQTRKKWDLRIILQIKNVKNQSHNFFENRKRKNQSHIFENKTVRIQSLIIPKRIFIFILIFWSNVHKKKKIVNQFFEFLLSCCFFKLLFVNEIWEVWVSERGIRCGRWSIKFSTQKKNISTTNKDSKKYAGKEKSSSVRNFSFKTPSTLPQIERLMLKLKCIRSLESPSNEKN
jgi:hypothetical protein